MNDYISKTSNIESKIAGPNSKDYDLGRVLNIPFNNSVASISLFPDRKLLLKAIEWSDVVHIHEPFIPLIFWKLPKNKKYIFAYNACEAGYTANNVSGLFCQKNSPYELEVCPQANLYRIMDGKETKGKLYNPTFNSDTREFLKKNTLGKARMIDDYVEEIKTNNKVCSQTMKSKDTILKTYCSKSTNDKSVASQLCYDIYCRNDKREPFCHKLEYVGKNDTVKISQSFESLIILLIFVTFIVLASGHYLKNTSSS